MKEKLKHIFKILNIYHPLQSFYRNILKYIRKKQYRFLFRKYKGKGFECSVCHSRYTRFAGDYPSQQNEIAITKNKVVAGYGVNVICPWCLSTARDRLVLQMLKEMDPNGLSILHLSPEKCIYDFLSKANTVTTADIIPGFYKKIDKGIIKQDATRFTFEDNTFDIIIANHVLEHIPNDVLAMKEIYRVLKPEGTAILQVPYTNGLETIEDPLMDDPAIQSLRFGQKDHVRIYSLIDYKNRLTKAGFEVSIIPYASLQRFFRYAIQENEDFIRIYKPPLFL